jgi:hypothetical protein
MGVMTLKAEPLADFGVFALVILADNLFMALSTINHTQPLRMRNIINIVMTINAVQITVDRGAKCFIVHIEGKLPFVHLLFFRCGDDHLEPFFPAHLKDIAGSMTFETRLILESKSRPWPRTEGKWYQQHQRDREKKAN